MTHEEAQHKLFDMLESKTGAMVPVGKVDNLLSEIFKDFEKERKTLIKALDVLSGNLAEVSLDSGNKPVNNINYGGTKV